MSDSPGPDRLELLRRAVRTFAEERDWQQFHDAKNLSMALAGEVGELVAELQWTNPKDLDRQLARGTPTRTSFEDEIADVLIYLVRLADVTGVDLAEAAHRKLAQNAVRYTIECAHGSAVKQTQRTSIYNGGASSGDQNGNA